MSDYNLGLFEAYGIEIEYMIVSAKDLKILPIADTLLTELNGGELNNEVEMGKVAWSNELVSHVMELKCAKPMANLLEIDLHFSKAFRKLNQL